MTCIGFQDRRIQPLCHSSTRHFSGPNLVKPRLKAARGLGRNCEVNNGVLHRRTALEDLFAALEPYYWIHGSTRANESPNYFAVFPGGFAGKTEASATLPFAASPSET